MNCNRISQRATGRLGLKCRCAATNSKEQHRLEWTSAHQKIVARCSWFVARKNLPLYKNRYGQISQRAARGSLYRGAGRQRRSERLKDSPYAHGRWPCFFVTCDCVIPITWLRCRRGRPKGVPPRSLCIPGFYNRWLVVRKNIPIILEWAVMKSLWRASHGKPLQFGHGPCIFCGLRTTLFFHRLAAIP